MKKTVKNLFLIMVMAVLLLGLTACGDNDKSEDKSKKSSSDKLVATRSSEDSYFGKYDETIEVTFKDDKADKIVMTRDLESEEKAESIEKVFSYLDESELEGMKVERDGKKIIITFDSKAFAEEENLDEDNLSRDYIKKQLEDDGYTIE